MQHICRYEWIENGAHTVRGKLCQREWSGEWVWQKTAEQNGMALLSCSRCVHTLRCWGTKYKAHQPMKLTSNTLAVSSSNAQVMKVKWRCSINIKVNCCLIQCKLIVVLITVCETCRSYNWHSQKWLNWVDDSCLYHIGMQALTNCQSIFYSFAARSNETKYIQNIFKLQISVTAFQCVCVPVTLPTSTLANTVEGNQRFYLRTESLWIPVTKPGRTPPIMPTWDFKP